MKARSGFILAAILNHCVNLNNAFSYSEVSVSSSIVICITYTVDTYMVPSSATVSQGGRYLYSHFIDEETEGQPQLMHSWCILTTVDAFWPCFFFFLTMFQTPLLSPSSYSYLPQCSGCSSLLSGNVHSYFITTVSYRCALTHQHKAWKGEIESTVQNKGHAWILVVDYMWVDRESGLQVNRPISGLDAWVVMVEYRKKLGEIISWVLDILSLRCRLPLQWRYSARGSQRFGW